MGANVFANGREISAKASGNKTITMPDVCLSPPSPPAGPIPIPYPNFANAKNTTGGTKKVKIGGKEVGLKGKSSYKKSEGDKAATRNFGASMVTHNLEGSVKHQAGSFDVKFEGTNVVRFGDLTTVNHSNPGFPLGPDQGKPAPPPTIEDCKELDNGNAQDREDLKASENTAAQRAGDGGTNVNYKLKGGPDGVPARASAHSWKAAAIESPNHLEGMPYSPSDDYDGPTRQGLKSGTNPDKTDSSNVDCDAADSFNYRSPAAQTSGHAEPRIIEEIFSAAGGVETGVTPQLTLKIDWKSRNSCAPCASCHALMCAAIKCGLEIWICDKDNKPQKLTEDDCEKDLNMQKPEERKKMNKKNEKLAMRLNKISPKL